jgi:hypothetical protein
MSREVHAIEFNFVDVFGKGARRRVQQGTAADRMKVTYTVSVNLQGVQKFISKRRHSRYCSALTDSCRLACLRASRAPIDITAMEW